MAELTLIVVMLIAIGLGTLVAQQFRVPAPVIPVALGPILY